MQDVKLETELEVITPNEPGILGRVLGTMANAGVNLRAMCVLTFPESGRFRLLTSDNKKAEAALRTIGYKVKSQQVLTVEIGDRIGAGAEVGALLGNAVIDIQTAYASSTGKSSILLVFQTNANKKAYETLR
ncbi:MAG: ACT domain-containing protein [Candidatus Aminicenantales bacterium]